MFCLFYDAKTKKISALNGSGRSSAKSTLEATREALGLKDGDVSDIPLHSVHSVTVPGAAAGWVDTVERFGSGKVSMEQILAPSIELAERGFPVSELSSTMVSTILNVRGRITLTFDLVEKWGVHSQGSFSKLFGIVEERSKWTIPRS